VEDFESNLGMSRRTLLKRGAVVGGTLVWAAPAVQTLASSAMAASTSCNASTCANVIVCNSKGQNCMTVGHLTCAPTNPDDEQCLCVCAGQPGSCPEAQPCEVPLTCGNFQPGPCS
jgi:hypothetical protein